VARQRLTWRQLQPNVVRREVRAGGLEPDLVMEPLLPWIVALVVLVIALVAVVAWRITRDRSPRVKPLPTEW